MKVGRCLVSLLLAAWNQRTTAATLDRQTHTHTSTTDNADSSTSSASATAPPECGLYLAKSLLSAASIKGADQEWGMYTGKTLEPGDICVGPDLAVNLHNLAANNLVDQPDQADLTAHSSLTRQIGQHLANFVWQSNTGGADGELVAGQGDAAMFVPGPGFLAFFDSKKSNADFDFMASYHRFTINEEPGVPHPGRGSLTPFHNLILRATKDIPAGTELLLNFGDDDSADEENEDEDPVAKELADDTIKKEDYAKIDETIAHMVEFFQKYDSELKGDAKLQIYKFLTDDFMKAAVGPAKARKLAEIFPATPDELAAVQAAGGITFFNKTDSATKRTMDWLQTNGLCMDNIQAGPSTIPNVGRGAFATRDIPSGGLIAPVPLLHIPDKAALLMYPVGQAHGKLVKLDDTVQGEQLVMNYVYGHPESTMVFFPAGSIVNFINHHDDADKVNAVMKWSEHPMHHKDWFDVDPKEFVASTTYQRTGLLMEIVTTRKIEAGEEIFLDYGAEWKAAWKNHQDKWKAKLENEELADEWPILAGDLNAELLANPLRTEDEQQEDPYPESVRLRAFLYIAGYQGSGTEEDPYVYEELEATSVTPDLLLEVEIVERDLVELEDGDESLPYVYTARFVDENDEYAIVSDVPHEAFVFVDIPESGDQFTADAFRHYIGIPDEIFPQGKWRNAQP